MANRDYGAAVWNDVRDAAVCEAINTYRQAFVDGVTGGGAAPIVADRPRDLSTSVHPRDTCR